VSAARRLRGGLARGAFLADGYALEVRLQCIGNLLIINETHAENFIVGLIVTSTKFLDINGIAFFVSQRRPYAP
jgi:hypothetical protein